MISHSHILGVNETLNTSVGSFDVKQCIEKLIEIAQDLERGTGNEEYSPDQMWVLWLITAVHVHVLYSVDIQVLWIVNYI